MADLINKVVRFHEFGPAEVLRVENVEVREPGPGEVRIKIAAIGLISQRCSGGGINTLKAPSFLPGLAMRLREPSTSLGPL